MFVCERCREITRPGEPMTRIVVETRRVERTIDRGTGTEIVREAKLCPRCAAEPAEPVEA